MDRIASALTGKIGQKQIHVRVSAGIILIDAQQEISLPQDVESIPRYSDIPSAPLAQLLGESLKRLTHRHEFILAASVKENRGDRQQRSSNKETRARIHAQASFPGDSQAIRDAGRRAWPAILRKSAIRRRREKRLLLSADPSTAPADPCQECPGEEYCPEELPAPEVHDQACNQQQERNPRQKKLRAQHSYDKHTESRDDNAKSPD